MRDPYNGHRPLTPRRIPLHDEDLDEEVALAPLDLRRMFAIVRRHFGLVVTCTLVAAAAAAAYAKLRAPTYTATAVIRLRDTRAQISGGLATDGADALGGPEVSPLLSLVELLSSRTMAGTVVDSLPLLRLQSEDLPLDVVRALRVGSNSHVDSLKLQFGPDGIVVPDAPEASPVPYGMPLGNDSFVVMIARRPKVEQATLHLRSRDDAIRALLLNLSVRPRESTDVVDVRFSAGDSLMARRVADRLVSVFQSANAFSEQTESRARRQFLGEQLEEANSNLARARDALVAFRAKQRAFSARDRFTAQQAQAGTLQSRRRVLDEQRTLYAGLLRRLDDSSTGGDALLALLASPGLEDKPLIAEIASQLARYQVERDSLTSGPYGSAPTNPDVARLTSLIAAAQSRLRAAVQSSVTVLNQQIRDLDAQRVRAAPPYRELSRNESDETALVAAVESADRQVTRLQEEYQSARLSEAVRVGQVELVDYAGPPERAGLASAVLVAAGLLLGGLIGMFLAFFLDYVRPTIWRQRDLAQLLESPNPIVLPRFRPKAPPSGGRQTQVTAHRPRTELVMLTEPGGGTAEAVRAIRTKLLFSGNWGEIRTLLVTSAKEGEGKSTVASNLAVSFAQQGVKTLLVDGDMRKPHLHHLFGKQREPGLSDVLREAVQGVAAIVQTDVEQLSLLPAGKAPVSPAELLGGPALHSLLARLATAYDLILVDSPPLLAVADASVIAAAADGVLMVVKAGASNRDMLDRARSQLEDVRARMVGAVLNDPAGAVARGGEEYYFYGYASEHEGNGKH
jgi:capsular exopolysaccharide synthesis family protein